MHAPADTDMPCYDQEMQDSELPPEIPPAEIETISVLPANPDMILNLQDEDGHVTSIPLDKQTMITLTPKAKKSRGIEVNQTPVRSGSVDSIGRTKRLQNLTPLEKVEVLDQFFQHAQCESLFVMVCEIF